MIKYPFNLIQYFKPRFYQGNRYIKNIIGLDTETYKNGRPFMFALSDGSVFTSQDIPDVFFTRQYRNKQFGVWNIKFDSGSLISSLPAKFRTELRKYGECNYKDYGYKYIAHKMLRISKGKNAVTIWDINNIYKCSLDFAARTYIGDKKNAIQTKVFTKAYVKKNWKQIAKYCIHDANLVSLLYDRLFRALSEAHIKPTALYSRASIAYTYFNKQTAIVDVWRFWKENRGLLQYACSAYAGGKFEIYRRGRFEGVSYDINSAYPYEMSNLLDITKAKVAYGKRYRQDSTYGFIRAYIDNTKARHVSCAVKYGQANIYPAGTYEVYITKQEYDYLMELKIKVKILSAYWLYCDTTFKPYEQAVKKVHKLKDYYKPTDLVLSGVYKYILNGFYGKMMQLVSIPYKPTQDELLLLEEGKIKETDFPPPVVKPGAAWNPIFAAVITANTRIRMSRIANEYGLKVYSVHTDSVIMSDTLPKDLTGKGLGQWTYEKEGDGVIIACGIYQIGKECKFRGMEVSGEINWKSFLSEHGSSQKIVIPQQVVHSWTSANFRGKDNITNIFETVPKELDLNCDRKRVWENNCNAKILCNGHQNSYPHILLD